MKTIRPEAPSLLPSIAGFLVSFVLAVLLVAIIAASSQAAELRVRIDQASIIKLDRPVAEVIVGNPSIADVSVQSGKALVVTGKSVGLTNLMVMDGAGSIVYDKKVSVSVDPQHLVTLNKGVGRETYSCAPTCGPAFIPGDTATFIEELNKAIRGKLGLAQASAEGAVGQQ